MFVELFFILVEEEVLEDYHDQPPRANVLRSPELLDNLQSPFLFLKNSKIIIMVQIPFHIIIYFMHRIHLIHISIQNILMLHIIF